MWYCQKCVHFLTHCGVLKQAVSKHHISRLVHHVKFTSLNFETSHFYMKFLLQIYRCLLPRPVWSCMGRKQAMKGGTSAKGQIRLALLCSALLCAYHRRWPIWDQSYPMSTPLQSWPKKTHRCTSTVIRFLLAVSRPIPLWICNELY